MARLLIASYINIIIIITTTTITTIDWFYGAWGFLLNRMNDYYSVESHFC